MALLLVVLFVLVPIAELAVIVVAADAFGLGVTLGALLLFSVSGAWLMKREGLAVWRRTNEELAAGRPPAREMVDGAMVLGGGALLLTPGFLTDFVGLMLLLAPVRALIRPVLLRAMTRRATVAMTDATTGARAGAAWSQGGRFGGFESVVVDADLFEPDGVPAQRPAGSARVIRVESDGDHAEPGELEAGS